MDTSAHSDPDNVPEPEYDPPVQTPEAFRLDYRQGWVGPIAQDSSGPGDWAGVAVAWRDHNGRPDPCPYRIRVVNSGSLTTGFLDRPAIEQLHAALGAALALNGPELTDEPVRPPAVIAGDARHGHAQSDVPINAATVHWMPSDS